MSGAWTSEGLRYQVGAFEHMLALTLREYEADPTPGRLEGLHEAAMWLQQFRSLLNDQLQAESVPHQERRAA